jgi:hypothetical protein
MLLSIVKLVFILNDKWDTMHNVNHHFKYCLLTVVDKEKLPLWFYLSSNKIDQVSGSKLETIKDYNILECLRLCQEASPSQCSVDFYIYNRKSTCRLPVPYSNRYSPVGSLRLSSSSIYEYWEIFQRGECLIHVYN